MFILSILSIIWLPVTLYLARNSRRDDLDHDSDGPDDYELVDPMQT